MGSSYTVQHILIRKASWNGNGLHDHIQLRLSPKFTVLQTHLSWPTLQQRTLYSKLFLFHKIIHRLTIPSQFHHTLHHFIFYDYTMPCSLLYFFIHGYNFLSTQFYPDTMYRIAQNFDGGRF